MSPGYLQKKNRHSKIINIWLPISPDNLQNGLHLLSKWNWPWKGSLSFVNLTRTGLWSDPSFTKNHWCAFERKENQAELTKHRSKLSWIHWLFLPNDTPSFFSWNTNSIQFFPNQIFQICHRITLNKGILVQNAIFQRKLLDLPFFWTVYRFATFDTQKITILPL